MNIFSEEKKQEVLDALFTLATDDVKGNVPAIKLYLELAGEHSPSEALTLEKAIDVIRDFADVSETPPQATRPLPDSPTRRHPERSEGPL